MSDPTSSTKDKKADAAKDKGKEDAADEPIVISEEDLTEEDYELKKLLDKAVEDIKADWNANASSKLEELREQIMTATSSMTSIPKPLKFLTPHTDSLIEVYEAQADSGEKTALADLVSVLCVVRHDEKRECLKYRLVGNCTEADIISWGNEYVRHLSGEIAEEYTARLDEEASVDELMGLVDIIVPYNMSHAAETDAVDLLIEVECLPRVTEFVTKANYERVANYLLSCADYIGEPDNILTLHTVYALYEKMEAPAQALRVALRLGDPELISTVYMGAEDPVIKAQLAHMIGRQRGWVEDEDDDDLLEYMGNTGLSAHFLYMARDLDIMEPKTPEDIYKSHLETVSRGGNASNVDSARKNLAATYVNAFVNAGFGTDTLVSVENSDWLYRNKDHGVVAAAASLGFIHLWDWDTGSSNVNKFFSSKEPNIIAGGLIAIGLVNSGVRSDYDAAYAMLEDYADNADPVVRSGLSVGLGLAYAGHAKDECRELLAPIIMDADSSLEVVVSAAVSLGMIFVGSCNIEVASMIAQVLLEHEEVGESSFASMLALSIGLVFLGKQDEVDLVLELLKAAPEKIRETALITVEVCAYAGTGDVLKVQKMLHTCADHLGEDESALHQAVAVLGIALIAIGEDLGSEMALRSFNHCLQFCEIEVRRAVPLAIGLLKASDVRDISVIDTLSKLSHDSDAETAQCAILALGLVGAGTNNARLAGLLRELAAYYAKDANSLFMVRIAQGLLYMGKGTLTLSPFNSDGLLMNNVGVAGLLAVCYSALSLKDTILGRAHFVLTYLSVAMSPRMLITVDENLEYLPVNVRVGEALDVVGQAGKPKTITGFQTNMTPVLLGQGERAELVSDKYIPCTSVLEGIVILRPNPDYDEEEESGIAGKK